MQINDFSSTQINISNTQTSSAGTKPPEGPPPPPSHEQAVSEIGASLTEDQQGEVLSGIEAMQEEGASDEEIKAYVDSSLEEYGINLAQARGTITNTIA
nr:hypothetical protein [uncultured Desulfobacter sp.]